MKWCISYYTHFIILWSLLYELNDKIEVCIILKMWLPFLLLLGWIRKKLSTSKRANFQVWNAGANTLMHTFWITKFIIWLVVNVWERVVYLVNEAIGELMTQTMSLALKNNNSRYVFKGQWMLKFLGDSWLQNNFHPQTPWYLHQFYLHRTLLSLKYFPIDFHQFYHISWLQGIWWGKFYFEAMSL